MDFAAAGYRPESLRAKHARRPRHGSSRRADTLPGHPDFQPVDPALVPRFADIATFMRTRRHEVPDAIADGIAARRMAHTRPAMKKE